MDRKENIILVTGARGKQGGAVARELLSKGYRVRAMTRQPQSEGALALARLNAEVAYGDFDIPSSLEKVLEGVWGVFSVQDSWEAGVQREEEQGKRLASLAKKAGVRHFVYTSVGSAHHKTGIPHFNSKWRIEETIRELGFPSFTIIRPVFFMENFLSPWFKPPINQGKLTIGIRPETRLQMIAVPDIGKCGSLAFERHEEMNGRSIDLAGDELSMPETARILSGITGTNIVVEPTPIEDVRKFSEDFAVMLEWFDRVGYSVDIPVLANTFGFRMKTFREWATSVDWR